MKQLLITIALLFMLPVSGQNLHTNEPESVYPVLEEFIAENFENQVRSFQFINRIDSINVVSLKYPLYGKHIRRGENHTIYVHRWLLEHPRRFERTLKHELGHVFGLVHIPVNEVTCVEIMSSEHWEEVGHYYADPKIWQRINSNYYQSLKKLQ